MPRTDRRTTWLQIRCTAAERAAWQAKAAAERYAQRDGVSLNQFISMAVAEKVGAAGAVEFFEKRSAGGKPERALAFLEAAPDRPPAPGDEPPN